MIIDHVYVKIENGSLPTKDIEYYINRVKKRFPSKQLKSLELYIGNGFIDMRYAFHDFPLERIRRVNTFTLGDEQRVV